MIGQTSLSVIWYMLLQCHLQYNPINSYKALHQNYFNLVFKLI